MTLQSRGSAATQNKGLMGQVLDDAGSPFYAIHLRRAPDQNASARSIPASSDRLFRHSSVLWPSGEQVGQAKGCLPSG